MDPADIEMDADPWLESAGSAPGWNVADYQGITVITKDGASLGFVAYMAFIPGADTGIVVLSNLDIAPPAVSVQWRLAEMLYGLEPKVEEFLEDGLGQFFAGASDGYSQLLPVDLESVAPYLGEYESAGNPYTIEWRYGGLWFGQGTLDIVQLLASPEGGYVAISPNDFYLPFQFVEGEDGSITLVIAGEIEAPKLGPVAGNEQPTQAHVAASLGRPFQLMAGQTAKIEPDGLWVEFLEVEEDSRCPLDALCIQAGRARVKIRVSNPAGGLGFGVQELTLDVARVNPNTDTVTGASGVFLVEASVLAPYPRASAQGPPKYIATLTVTQTSVLPI